MSVSTETAGERPAAGALGLPWIITASSVGTLIEWYDFYLYGVLALFFSRHFFSPEPALDAWTAAKDRNDPGAPHSQPRHPDHCRDTAMEPRSLAWS
jgi:hypothetical protein